MTFAPIPWIPQDLYWTTPSVLKAAANWRAPDWAHPPGVCFYDNGVFNQLGTAVTFE